MSIIYDALKKAEKNVAVNAGPEQPKPEPKPEKKTANEEKKVERKLYLVYILIICLTLFLANAAYNYLTSAKNKSLFSLSKIFPNKKPKPTPYSLSTANKPAAPKPAPYINAPAATPGSQSRESRGPFVLNGTFFSENQGYALINNKIVKDGDTVDGAVVKRVGLDEVELEQDGKTVKLYNR